MTEPRSVSLAQDRWITDSRVYNLIWLGRWLERAENIARVTNAAVLRVERDGGGAAALDAALRTLAASLGIILVDDADPAQEIMLRNESSSILQCLRNARSNATQVAPVEVVRAICDVILAYEAVDPASFDSPRQLSEAAAGVMAGLIGVGQSVEDTWFGREALTEEEIYHRFAQ